MERSNVFLILLLLSGILYPAMMSASVQITEIMYDPFKTDSTSGSEWIEVQNISGDTINLTEWIFYENEVDHGITAVVEGEGVIPPNGYAIISRDPTAFKNYFTSFNGLLLRSVFALTDSETIAMKSGKKDAPIVDSVTYTSEWGAKNDGLSLQLVNGSWGAFNPTPGKENSNSGASIVQYTQENTSSSTDEEADITTQDSGSVPLRHDGQKKIEANAGIDRTAFVGADIEFRGEGFGLKGEPLSIARYTWNFGDGTFLEGKNVLHRYRHAGVYTAVLSVSSGEFTASDYVTVTVVTPTLTLIDVKTGSDGYVSVRNDSTLAIDITSWSISTQNGVFVFPSGTMLAPKSTAPFGTHATGLVFSPSDTVLLRNTLGTEIARYAVPALQASTVNPQSYQKTTPQDIPSSRVVSEKIITLPEDERTVAVLNEDNDKNKKDTVEDVEEDFLPIVDTSINTSTLVAQVSSGMTPQNGDGIVWWLLALIPLGFMPVYALYQYRKQGIREADEYDILEEE